MTGKWRIIVYETLSGDKPVEIFILSLDIKARNKIVRTLEHLEEFGPELGYPHLKKLTGTTLWELRILGSDSIRILYITISGKTFLLLHGFKKKQQKTPSKEITVAEKRLTEFIKRKKQY